LQDGDGVETLGCPQELLGDVETVAVKNTAVEQKR
jgi:hypothetical protein